MRTYHDIHLDDRTIDSRNLEGEAIVKARPLPDRQDTARPGRRHRRSAIPGESTHLLGRPLRRIELSNANRTSVGCKSPLTGGVKEANGGGSFSYGLGQLKIAGFTLHGASPDSVVIHFKKGGGIDFDDAAPYLGRGNFAAQDMLHARYGKKVTIALCGPVGEYLGLIAGSPSATRTGARRACRRGAASER